jgi:hypothetical protein
MKKTLLLLTITGALMTANAYKTTNYSDIHDIKGSKSSLSTKYIDVYNINKSKSSIYLQDK